MITVSSNQIKGSSGVYNTALSNDHLFHVQDDPNRNAMLWLSRHATWYLRHLDKAWSQLTNSVSPAQTLKIYFDLVNSTLVGSQKVPLLRQMTTKDSKAACLQLEPLPYQWISMRNTDPVIVEVELSDLNGQLITLPHGKTVVTVGLKEI